MNVTFIFSGEKTVQIRPSDGKYCAEFRYNMISRETVQLWSPGSLLSIRWGCLHSHLRLYIFRQFCYKLMLTNISCNGMTIESYIYGAGDKVMYFLKDIKILRL